MRSGPAEKSNPPDKSYCVHCGDVIGAYEPMILVVDGDPRRTSPAAEPHGGLHIGERYHADCYVR